ncbi:MAG: hypothetical protein H6817_08765 [Phycisphaerales bacterium]|nr:hypothetical protein [Phycisphaerales bacterium]
MWSDDVDDIHDDVDDLDVDDLGDDENETLPCPSCGRAVYEDVDKCPYCGDWITPLSDHHTRPNWARIVGVLLVAALLFGVVSGLLRWFR